MKIGSIGVSGKVGSLILSKAIEGDTKMRQSFHLKDYSSLFYLIKTYYFGRCRL